MRIYAIILKDWKDTLKNSYMLFTIFLPLGLSAMLSKMDTSDPIMIMMPINIALVMTGAFVQATMMAEEKEKNTLRVMLLSPASTTEIMIGKSVLTAIITIFVVIGSVILSDVAIPNLFYFSIMVFFSLIIFISFGTIIGLLSRTVMETSVVGLPVLILFTYGSMLGTMLNNEKISELSAYLPTESFGTAMGKLGQNGGFADIKWELLNMFIWAAAILIVTVIFYGKRRFDK